MSDDTIELIRDVDPCPSRVSAPPFEVMLERVSNDPADDVDASRPGSGSVPGGSGPRWRNLGWRATGAVVAAAVAVAVVAVVVVVAGHGANQRQAAATTPGEHNQRQKTPVATAKPQTWSQRLRASRQALIDELEPLRRPQTVAERAFARTLDRHEPVFEELPRGTTIDRRLVRYATTTPWGARLYFVPVTPPTPQQVRAHEGAGTRTVPPVEGLVVESTSRFESVYGTAARLANGTVGISFWGPGGPASGVTQGYEPVPDGVSKVTYVLARQPGGSQYGYPTYPRVGHLTVDVHRNIAAWQARRAPGTVSIWYGATGRVVKRFGNPASAAKVVAVKQPGPETPRSRAAERDPSTPNPVTVTPVTTDHVSSYRLQFRALLNGADYGLRWSAPHCPGIELPGGIGGYQSVRLRGSLVTTTVTPRQSCHGTYRVSVRVIGLEPIGTIRPVGRKIHAKPFGTATFTVH